MKRQIGLVTVLLLAGCWGFSQTNEEVFREYQFNFKLPGARANGMGGAFIGVADDATSSFTNPAGLAFLTETAVTFEYRHTDFDSQAGVIEGNFNTRFLREKQALDTAAFFSLNFSWKSWYFAVFQNELLNEKQQREFLSRSLTNGIERIENRRISLDLEGVTRGLGVARRFGNKKVGLTLNYFTLEGTTDYRRETFQISEPIQSALFQSAINDRNHAWGFSLGFLHEPGTKFSWGAVWRGHPAIELEEEAVETVNSEPVLDSRPQVPFVIPDVLGIGARYKPIPTVSILFDWQRIYYSQMIDQGFVIVESLTTETVDNYTVGDINEFHSGVEWLIPGDRSVWAVRGGYWRNPLHAVTYRGEDPAIQDRFGETGLSDEDHVTLGFGWVYLNRFEIDLSANFWDDGTEVTASFIWRKK